MPSATQFKKGIKEVITQSPIFKGMHNDIYQLKQGVKKLQTNSDELKKDTSQLRQAFKQIKEDTQSLKSETFDLNNGQQRIQEKIQKMSESQNQILKYMKHLSTTNERIQIFMIKSQAQQNQVEETMKRQFQDGNAKLKVLQTKLQLQILGLDGVNKKIQQKQTQIQQDFQKLQLRQEQSEQRIEKVLNSLQNVLNIQSQPKLKVQ